MVRCAVAAWNDHKIVSAKTEAVQGLSLGNDLRMQRLRRPLSQFQNGLRIWACGDGYARDTRGPGTKRDSQSKCQQQGKHENPEDYFRLALHLLDAREEEVGVSRPAAVLFRPVLFDTGARLIAALRYSRRQAGVRGL